MTGRLTRALAAALVAVVPLTGGVAGAARGDRADGVFAVPADGTTVTTAMVTNAAAEYVIRVTGTFAHDSRGGLADCGYRDADYSVTAQSWVAGTVGLTVDESPAPCGTYDDAHAYEFRVRGTGSRLRFAIADPGGHADNAGALTVSVVTESELDGDCAYQWVPLPNSASGYLSVTAVAYQGGFVVDNTYTAVRCEVFVDGVLVLVLADTMPGLVVAQAGRAGPFQLADVRVCLSAEIESFYQVQRYERVWPCTS